jgi:hypothetical protein
MSERDEAVLRASKLHLLGSFESVTRALHDAGLGDHAWTEIVESCARSVRADLAADAGDDEPTTPGPPTLRLVAS